MNPYVLAFWIALPALWLAARRWGGRTELTVASLYVAAATATVLVRTTWSGRYHHVEPGVMLVDVMLLVALARVATLSSRWWPIWSTALQAITTLSHVGKALNPGFMPLGYAIMSGASSYPALIVLACGTAARARRIRRARSAISRGSPVMAAATDRSGRRTRSSRRSAPSPPP